MDIPHFIDWMTMMECIADKKYVLGKTTQTESHVKGWTVCCLDRVPVLRKQKKWTGIKEGSSSTLHSYL